MFGYVNIYKDELKVKDYNIYRSYYCGLCKTLGKEFSQKVRLTLSYDFTFLFLMLSSLNDEKMNIKAENCAIHPFSKRPVISEDDFASYSACMSVIVTYFKLKDDLFDKRNLKSLISVCLFKSALKKAKKRYYAQYKKIEELIKELAQKEKQKVADIDEVSHVFGELLKVVFTFELFEDNPSQKRAVELFSYQLGRFIYIADALDDIEKDIKNKNYNPFVLKYNYNGEEIIDFKKKIKEEYDIILTLTLESIASAFELISFKKNRSIAENIVYLGLRKVKDRVLNSKGEKNGSV